MPDSITRLQTALFCGSDDVGIDVRSSLGLFSDEYQSTMSIDSESLVRIECDEYSEGSSHC